MTSSIQTETDEGFEQSDGLIRMRGLSQLLGVNQSTVYRWIVLGKFPRPSNIGFAVSVWRRKDVTDWIEQNFRTAKKHCPPRAGRDNRVHRIK